MGIDPGDALHPRDDRRDDHRRRAYRHPQGDRQLWDHRRRGGPPLGSGELVVLSYLGYSS